MKYFFSILFIFSFTICFAQKQANVWYFGNRAGLNFNSGAPVVLSNSVMNTDEGCATISDAQGNLLFYTDGRKIINRQHQLMLNGSDLGGSVSSTQSAVIIKSPGSDSIYFVFTVGAERQETGLRYSVVNMNRGGGLGEVVEKNVLLLENAFEKIGAVNHCNNRDSWVVTRKFNSQEYYSFLVTKNGVERTPVMSGSGLTVGGDGVNSIGVLRFSSNGRFVAAVHSYQNDIVELMDFDGLTGKLSNPRLLRANPAFTPNKVTMGAYGAEFSSDSKLLYTTWYSSEERRGLIAQFDITASTQAQIQGSRQEITSGTAMMSAIQMGPDRKIYVSCINENYISVINKPDIKGAACDFQYQVIKLGEAGQRFCIAGLPSFVQSYFSPTSMSFDFARNGSCSERNAKFFINRIAGADSVSWNFGDPSSGVRNISDEYNPEHVYSQTGVYQVMLIVFKNDCSKTNDTIKQDIWIAEINENLLGADRRVCSGESIEVSVPVNNIDYTWSTGSSAPDLEISQSGLYWLEINQLGCIQRDSILVDFKPTPSVSLGRDTALCAGESLTLNVATPGASYQWNTGHNGPELTIRNSGTYSVEISVEGCSASDTVQVEPGTCKLFIPNAFTPNGDGLNDDFGMLNTGSIGAYSFAVFDRWGKRIFSTTDKTQRWNGMAGSRPADPGVYVWILSYTKNGDSVPVSAKGTVQLIR